MEDHTYRTLADSLAVKPFKSVAVLFGTQQRALILSVMMIIISLTEIKLFLSPVSYFESYDRWILYCVTAARLLLSDNVHKTVLGTIALTSWICNA